MRAKLFRILLLAMAMMLAAKSQVVYEADHNDPADIWFTMACFSCVAASIALEGKP